MISQKPASSFNFTCVFGFALLCTCGGEKSAPSAKTNRTLKPTPPGVSGQQATAYKVIEHTRSVSGCDSPQAVQEHAYVRLRYDEGMMGKFLAVQSCDDLSGRHCKDVNAWTFFKQDGAAWTNDGVEAAWDNASKTNNCDLGRTKLRLEIGRGELKLEDMRAGYSITAKEDDCSPTKFSDQHPSYRCVTKTTLIAKGVP